MADALKTIKENDGCFNNFMQGLLTIVTGGIWCYNRVQTYNKAKENASSISKTQENFQNNVVPLFEKLKGLNGVAAQLLLEANDKVEIVREFEEVVKNYRTKFEARKGRHTQIKIMRFRQNMIKDLDVLLAQCETTMEATKKR